MSRAVRSLVVLLVGVAVLGFAADRVVRSSAFRFPKDFLEYWAAGRLNARGENPYDPAALLAEQQTADPAGSVAVMMWNPPPALAGYMPLGWFPARWASLLWVGVQFVAVMLGCRLLWRTYHPGGRQWLAYLVGVTFVGTWWLVAYGQNTGLLVLGLAGFLHFTRNERPVAAGACAALTALKPHLLAGFGVLLLADAITHRGRTTLAAGVSVIALSLAVALLANPDVVGQFVAAVRDPGPGAVPLRDWFLPVPSFWLRMEINPRWFWLQFLPCAAACVVLVAWRLHAGRWWNWTAALPWVVAVSVLTTPYGGWVFDLPVLLVPVLAVAARLAVSGRWQVLAAFVAGQFAVTVVSLATPGWLHEYWWVSPAVLALCLFGVRPPVRRMPLVE